MHTVLLGLPMVDHKDRNPLNNQKENLRPATKAQNARNFKLPVHNTSGYKGVCFSKHACLYEAKIQVNRRTVYLGRFSTKQEAALAYNEAATKYHGEFACLNVI